ncbi:MAG: tRNA uridine-5-carboxymethylaminomethyl(34) synthesis enzyme MnmG [Actinobacteria bacterium]|nr:MAG: tRNA uridine-5-carboxymethylaminomethyl(34) synthesis enzyme MnmG [Actinomycetota bacterium]
MIDKRRTTNDKTYDVIVIGGGHAGCEAALAAARMGAHTLMLTINTKKIALMPCNPSVGGIGKGHLVREIDALGGEIAKNTDKSHIQIKLLNHSKGPAVQALRAQADKKVYEHNMHLCLAKQKNLEIKQALVSQVIAKKGKIEMVKTVNGETYNAHALVVAAGTFLNGRIIIGDVTKAAGRMGELPATEASDSLVKLGMRLERFQSATPPRIDGRTVDYSKITKQPGDKNPQPFSFTEEPRKIKQMPCYLTYTSPKTHQVVKKYLKYSPIKSGILDSHGPRYCPSIDRKVLNFPDKDRHPVFIEPEGLRTTEMYLQGLTTSMPASLQKEIIRTVPGLEKAEIMRLGYAVEYDYLPPDQLKLNLETKKIEGLFFAGQVIGTTGYEEAAALGLMAGINAALKARGKKPFVLDRCQAYIGVLIDDLVTKGVDEPYRMFTSRAEHRLLLRSDNADIRLSPLGYKLGLISKKRHSEVISKKKQIDQLISECAKLTIQPEQAKLVNLIQRPRYHLKDYSSQLSGAYSLEALKAAETEIKYSGYIQRQKDQIDKDRRLESIKIPATLNFNELKALSFEAREKLHKIKPASVGQASRIPGVTPCDISVLTVYLRQNGARK